MRWRLFAAGAIVAALGLPRIAAADVIDDFTIVGNGMDITFSLPATATVYVLQSYNHWYETFPEIENGISQTGSLSIWFDSESCTYQGSYLAGVLLCDNNASLWTVQSYVPILPPPPLISDYVGYFVIVWNPGTYTDTDFSVSGGPSCPAFSFYPPPCAYPEYTLTITPEAASTGATPEPGTLALLATGSAGGLAVSRRHRVGRT